MCQEFCFGTYREYPVQVNLLQTAVTNFGLSHGRNLLTKKAYQEGKGDNVNGYDNPYCRTWTYHHQYDTMDKLIRPSGLSTLNWEKFGRRNGSIEKLKQHSVLNKNGFVNITPTNEIDTTNNIDIKKCPFWTPKAPLALLASSSLTLGGSLASTPARSPHSVAFGSWSLCPSRLPGVDTQPRLPRPQRSRGFPRPL